METEHDESRAAEGEEQDPWEVLRGLERLRREEVRYEIEEEVASGGQGTILRVWDDNLRRPLAMKVMRDEGGLRIPGGRKLERFLEEAHITGRLDHPGIVPVHELGLDAQGRVFFTMKLVKGQNLSRVFKLLREGRGGWTQTRALNVLLKVCEAMAYAHSKGIVHRDLKPANVMVGAYGEVYVMDWGLARTAGDESSDDEPRERSAPSRDAAFLDDDDKRNTTTDGSILGTPSYMAPEQAFGHKGALGPRSDVYAAGAMLYSLLAGGSPYVGPDERLHNLQILERVKRGAPRPLHEIAPGAPAELVAICEKAMERAPERRYADMSELAEDLRAFLENRVVSAHRTGALAELRKWVQRNRSLAMSIAAVVLLLVGSLATFSYLQRQRAEQDRLLLRLSASDALEGLRRQADQLWPATPSMRPAYLDWLEETGRLLTVLDAELEELRQVQASGAATAGPESDRLERMAYLERLIASFEDPDTGLLDGGLTEHGWSIGRRVRFADQVEELTITGESAQRRWTEAADAVAEHPLYGGLELRPQLGLLPIGPDPGSTLWEFWHVQTGEEPQRGDDGRVAPTEEMGLVFVLLPGGEYWMGAQGTDPTGHNHDERAQANESPVRRVTISPFFFSKYEMTQGQWQRFHGSNPSTNGPLDHDPKQNVENLEFSYLLPVDNLDWYSCQRLTIALGLTLPSEAQWEYGARAGTETPWWAGPDPGDLAGLENLADAFAQPFARSWDCEEWSDGFFLQAPIGYFAPNSFGLYDVLGNVFEWCLDGYLDDAYERPGGLDPVVDPSTSRERAGRGGDYDGNAAVSRSAQREGGRPDYRSPRMGLRPARVLR